LFFLYAIPCSRHIFEVSAPPLSLPPRDSLNMVDARFFPPSMRALFSSTLRNGDRQPRFPPRDALRGGCTGQTTIPLMPCFHNFLLVMERLFLCLLECFHFHRRLDAKHRPLPRRVQVERSAFLPPPCFRVFFFFFLFFSV